MPNPSCEYCESRKDNPICSLDHCLNEIAHYRSCSSFKSGQTIFYQSSEPLGLFTVEKGLIKLETTNEAGQTHILRLAGPGSVLGYCALFTQEPYRASAIVVEDSKLCFLPKKFVFDLFQSKPEVALNLTQHLAKDLSVAEKKWIRQVDQEAPDRVAEALIFLNDQFENQTWTRKEIAQWAGTTPETVMRTLSRFEKEGWIDQEKRDIRIINRAALVKKFIQT